MGKFEATAINEETNEVVELKKKDAHALGLLCYAESELANRMVEYCESVDDKTFMGTLFQETAIEVCAVVFDNFKEIIEDIASAMIEDARERG